MFSRLYPKRCGDIFNYLYAACALEMRSRDETMTKINMTRTAVSPQMTLAGEIQALCAPWYPLGA